MPGQTTLADPWDMWVTVESLKVPSFEIHLLLGKTPNIVRSDWLVRAETLRSLIR